MKLKFDGIKGARRDLELGHATVITGPNGAGKSGVLAALHLALLGKVPAVGLGKGDVQDLGRLRRICDDGAWVALEIAGHAVRRDVEFTAKRARVVGKIDGDETSEGLSGELVFADFRRLVSAGDSERAQILSTYLPQPGDGEKMAFAKEFALAHIEAALSPAKKAGRANEPAIGPGNRPSLSRLEARCRVLAESNNLAQVLDRLLEKFSGSDPDALIDAIGKSLSTAVELAKINAAKMAGVRTVTDADYDLAHELPGLRDRVAELQGALSAFRSVRAVADGNRFRLSQIESELEKSVVPGEVPDLDALASALQSAIDCRDSDRADLAELKEVRSGLKAQLDGLKARVERLVNTSRVDVAVLEAKSAKLKADKPVFAPVDIAGLERERDATVAQITEISVEGAALKGQWKDAKSGLCPLTQAVCSELSSWSDEAKVRLDRLAETVRGLNEHSKELTRMIADARNAESDYRNRLSVWERAVWCLEGEIERSKASNRVVDGIEEESKRASVQFDEKEKEYALVCAEIERVLRGLEKSESIVTDAKKAFDEAQAVVSAIDRRSVLLAEKARLVTSVAAMPDPVNEAELELLQERLSLAEEAARIVEIHERNDVRRGELSVALLRAAQKGALAGITSCVQSATVTVVGVVSGLLRKMGLAADFWVDLESKAFGVVMDSGKVLDVGALSGGEQILFAAAMLGGLASIEKRGVRVLSLECAELDDDLMARMLGALPVEQFDAVIAVTHHEPSSIPKGWTHLKMSK